MHIRTTVQGLGLSGRACPVLKVLVPLPVLENLKVAMGVVNKTGEKAPSLRVC